MIYKVHASYMNKLYMVVINSYHQEVTFAQVLTCQEMKFRVVEEIQDLQMTVTCTSDRYILIKDED